MNRILTTAFLVALAGAGQAQGQDRTALGCLKLAGPSHVELRGRLSVQTFPGAPNYESVAAGDAPERTYLLKLPAPICIDDGKDGFADPAARFDKVQVSVTDKRLWPRLREHLGQEVTVAGQGYAAFDGHHHAPLVVLADRVDGANVGN